MTDISVKLFRWYQGDQPTLHRRWLPFLRHIIAVPFDPQLQAVRILTEQVTREGADQVIVTPSLFKALLRAGQSDLVEVTSVELSDDATSEEVETLTDFVRELRMNKTAEPFEWMVISDLLHRYPPRKAEAVVGNEGPGSRVVILDNGIIHSSDEAGLVVLSEALEPAVGV